MEIEVNGVRYSNFGAAQAELRLDALSNSFSFSASAQDGQPLPFVGGERCKIFADGEQVVDGFIEVVTVNGSAGSHDIDVAGRDRTGDLLDSSIDALSDLQPPISLAAVIRQVVAHIGPSIPAAQRIQVIDNVAPPIFSAASDLAAAEPGTGAWEFIEALARKRQVLLTSDADGNIVIARAEGTAVQGAGVIHRVTGDRSENNVLNFSVSYDTTGRYNLYRTRAQLNATAAAAFGGDTPAASIVDQSGVARDSAILATQRARQLVLVSETMGGSAEAQDRAVWERNIRRARGKVYSATVADFRHAGGALWAVNTLVRVEDEHAGIDGQMLVNSVRFSTSLGTGRTTQLGFVEPDAYTLTLEEPEEKTTGIGLTADLFA